MKTHLHTAFMHPRQEIVEIFSTFLQFSLDDSTKWLTDKALERNISDYLAKYLSLERSSSDWALYWHEVWRHQPQNTKAFLLARGHLYAYLQEVSYKAAKKIQSRLRLPEYSLQDFFLMAIANTDKVLKSFDPIRNPNLEAYAFYTLCHDIQDELRRAGVEVRSDWSLLKNSSEKRVYESLQRRGLSPVDIERYVLAWECFKLIYVSQTPRGNKQLPAPNSTTWEAIAQLYNQEQLSQLSQCTSVNATTIQQWMENSIKAIRAHSTPRIQSLNALLFNEDNTLQDTLPSDELTPLAQLLDDLETETRKALYQQMNSVLSNTIANADTQTQELLEMTYAGKLTQKEIRSQLEISQPTISRRLKSFKTDVFKKLQASLNISLTPDVIKNMNGLMDEWLEQYYGDYNEV